jgi:Zn-dependent protease with chaperone function
MRRDPFGPGQGQPAQRRRGINPRFLILLLFAGYGIYYWYSNQSLDPITGESVLIDRNLSIEDEKALGLQAYQEILRQERPVPPDTQIARQVRSIAERLVAKVPEVEAALAAENGQAPPGFSRGFDWEVNVIESDQANAFCLPGGKMAVYTGLVPVAQNENAMAVVMGHEIAHALLRHGAQRMAQQKLSQVGQMAGALSGMDPQQQQMIMAAMGYGYLLRASTRPRPTWWGCCSRPRPASIRTRRCRCGNAWARPAAARRRRSSPPPIPTPAPASPISRR